MRGVRGGAGGRQPTHPLDERSVRWTPTLYSDLLRTGDGTGPGLIAVYFQVGGRSGGRGGDSCLRQEGLRREGARHQGARQDRARAPTPGLPAAPQTVGFPTFLATADVDSFIMRVYDAKQDALQGMVAAGDIPLRAGVVDIVDEALAAGARVALLGATASDPADRLVDAARAGLGFERDVAVFVAPAPGRGDGGAPPDGGADSDSDAAPALSMEASFAAAAARVRQSAANELVAQMAAARVGGEGGIVVDQGLLAAAARGPPPASPQWFAAVAAALGARTSACAFVGANASVLTAARAAGVLAAACPPRSGRGSGEYPGADCLCDGFGAGGGATWRRLAAMLDKRRAG